MGQLLLLAVMGMQMQLQVPLMLGATATEATVIQMLHLVQVTKKLQKNEA